MGKFNNVEKDETTNYEGGVAYKRNSADAWLNFLFSSYLENTYYEDNKNQIDRFIELTNEVGTEYGPEFVSKAAAFARNELGMRSVTHLTAAILNEQSFHGKRDALRKLFYRPDDMCETFGAVEFLGSKPSHALVRAAGDKLSSLSEYQLSKYGTKKKNSKWGLYDLINVTHAHSAAIDKFKNGTLEEADTWENKISGERGSTENYKEWSRLVEEEKLGYIALIRNLRYIVNDSIDDSWIQKYLVPQLTNADKIHNSMVFPYQIFSAYKNMPIKNVHIVAALDTAFRIACGNIEKMPGNSMVILDVSGSMEQTISNYSNIKIVEVGACFAAMLYVSQECDFMKFGSHALACNYSKNENIFKIIKNMTRNANCGYGTDILCAFDKIEQMNHEHGNKNYSRLFIISDMQTMSEKRNRYYYYAPSYGYRDAQTAWEEVTPGAEVYSYDLANYSTQCFSPNPKFHFSTSLNEKVFSFIPYLEKNKSLVDYINENY